MERDTAEHPEHSLGRHHGRQHDPAEDAGVDLEQETIPLEDVGSAPSENPAVTDV